MLQPVELSITKNAEQITQIAHALSSPARMEILKLLTYKNLTIKQIADEIKQPLNTTLNHINLLEQAGLLATQISYTSKGKSKTCYRMLDSVNILLFDPSMDLPQLKYEEYQLPIGSFFDFFDLAAPGGLASATRGLGNDNDLSVFLLPERAAASLIWFTHGLLEYRVPLPPKQYLKSLTGIEISFEVCSEAPLYNNDSKSDISVFLNDTRLGVYTSPGDFGGRRGLLNPDYWPIGLTQFGMITNWKINASQTTLNSNFLSFVNLRDLNLEHCKKPYLSLKIGVEKNAVHVGGMNLFGKNFGDFPQDIIFRYIY